MLLDKGYYDYDYQEPSERSKAAKSEAKSDAELAERLRKMGLIVRPKAKPQPMSAEELQAVVMAEERKKQQGQGRTDNN